MRSLGFLTQSLVAFILKVQRKPRKLALLTTVLHTVNEKIHFRLSMIAQHC